jgi:hypothetical protein
VAVITLPVAAAGQREHLGVVTTLTGTATVTHAGATTPMPLRFRDSVLDGDQLTTAEGSLVRVLIQGKAVATVRERTSVTLEGNTSGAAVVVDSGRLAYNLAWDQTQPGDAHEIRTPNVTVRGRGAIVVVETESRLVSHVCVARGSVTVVPRGGAEVEIGAKRCVSIERGAVRPVSLPQWRDAPPLGDFDIGPHG